MEETIAAYLDGIEFGDLQQHEKMAVFPLLTKASDGPGKDTNPFRPVQA